MQELYLPGLPPPGGERQLSGDRALELLTRLSDAITLEEAVATPAGGGPPVDHPSRAWLPQRALQMETGLFTLVSPQIDLAIAPPFPIAGDLVTPVDLDSIAAHLEVPKTVVVILLRLGSYAVGVIDNGAVAASKSGTRYVKGRHKAGGQSQRRFERNREKWIRELFDRVCVELTKRLPEDRRNVDHVALGGDRHVLDDFVKRCPALSAMSDRILDRRVPVEKPGRAAIVEAVDAIWSVTLFRGPLRPS